jgi:DNA replication protein DnaC
MNTPDRLPLKSPTNILFRTVKADFRKLLPTVGKASINAVLLKWEDLAKDGVDIADKLGVKQDEGELAWLWVSRSVLQAILRLCRDQQQLLLSSLDFENLTTRLNQVLESDNLGLDNEFFQRPDQHFVTVLLKQGFADWLATNRIKAESITEISKSFNYYFIFALYQEAKTNSTTYQPIEWRIKQLNEKAGEKEKAWLKYGLWLQEQVDERLFGVEDFSLRQIYISLRAYVIREKKNQLKDKDKEYERVVMDLHSAIRDWLQQEDKRDGLRIICGGPGCGKSSFTKMLAAELAERGERVLWIPLNLLDPTKDLVKALDELIDGNLDNLYPPNPLKKEQSQQRLLVILDGLDELAMQGKLATEVAQQFLQRVKEDLQRFNQSSLRIKILVSGRELVVQHLEEVKDSQQILHLLPYWLSKEDLQKDSYVDEKKLLETDQRNDWWQRYGELKQKNYQGLPEELAKIETLQEITAQPLLNYLVALSYEAGELDFSEKITLNQIYKDLLHRVYKREWADIQHPTLKNAQISEDEFIEAMAEIAVACWHGNGRTTTLAEIEKHCQHSGIGSVLEVFKTLGSQGVTQLLTAFYFRQQGVQGTEKTFEFTHKSFREYLTVQRIIAEIEAIEGELGRNCQNRRLGWTEQECLRRWAVLCGAEAMDRYLFDWLLGEVQLRPVEDVAKWQQLFYDLISYMLLQGMPMEKLDGLTFLQMSEQSRNAEEALLVVLNVCARMTTKISKIDWEKPKSFGEWLSKLQGQRIDGNTTLAFECLSYLYYVL